MQRDRHPVRRSWHDGSTTLKAVIEEKFGSGIMSAIDSRWTSTGS
ncbi:MAG: cyanase [Pseudonocardiales bacterium]